MEVDKWVSELQNKIGINLKNKNTDKKIVYRAHKTEK